MFLLSRGKYAWLGHNWMGCIDGALVRSLQTPAHRCRVTQWANYSLAGSHTSRTYRDDYPPNCWGFHPFPSPSGENFMHRTARPRLTWTTANQSTRKCTYRPECGVPAPPALRIPDHPAPAHPDSVIRPCPGTHGGVLRRYCHEIADGSGLFLGGVFQRRWTKGMVTMDCNTWIGTLPVHPPAN